MSLSFAPQLEYSMGDTSRRRNQYAVDLRQGAVENAIGSINYSVTLDGEFSIGFILEVWWSPRFWCTYIEPLFGPESTKSSTVRPQT